MAVNATPQYSEAEQEYKQAKTAEEKLACLRKMYVLLPKHKASEKVQKDLKTKISELRKELEREKQSSKKTGVSYRIPKQGAGQYVFVGGPNVGKSALLASVTKAKPEVAEYPFTTREPKAGMMEWEDVRLQLIDLPPITADFMEPYVASMIRSSDAALFMVDLGDDDGPFVAEAVLEKLASVKTELVGELPDEDPELDPGIMHVKTILVANKKDAPDAEDRLEILKEVVGDRFPIHVISVTANEGISELQTAMFEFLNVIRIYTKQPGKPADMTSPFTCPEGSTVVDLAGLVHKDFIEKLKSAKVWGTAVHDGQSVGRDHVLSDKDVVELHV
ncbi:MAG: GTPase [Gemmataceae bacterium]